MNTTFLSDMNWLAVLVAAVAYFMLGALWYSVLFGKQWIKATGINPNNPDAKKGAGGIMAITFLLEVITCAGIGYLVYRLMLNGALAGIKLGVLTGVCFSAISVCISYMYQMKPRALHVIDSGYHIIGNIIAAVVLCLWH